MALSPDGLTALTGSEDETARLWEVATGRPLGLSYRQSGAPGARKQPLSRALSRGPATPEIVNFPGKWRGFFEAIWRD